MDTPVLLITGALTVIARAPALAYARRGAKIIAVGRKPEAGGALVAERRRRKIGRLITGAGLKPGLRFV